MFQFSLKTLMGSITLAAVFFALIFAVPDVVACLVFLAGLLLLLPALVAGTVYGRGYGRAFCIGCLLPFGGFLIMGLNQYLIMVLYALTDEMDWDAETSGYLKIVLAGFWVWGFLSGATGVAVRRMCRSGSKSTSTAAPKTIVKTDEAATELPTPIDVASAFSAVAAVDVTAGLNPAANGAWVPPDGLPLGATHYPR